MLKNISLTLIKDSNFEKIIKVVDNKTTLNTIICIHNTKRGPSLGGLRIYPYKSDDDSLFDVKRLSEGMTYKSSLANIPLGGGKSIINCLPKNITNDMLKLYAEILNDINGDYICAEDVGSNVEILDYIRTYTKFCAGISNGSGDPSLFTAFGVYRGIKATMETLYEQDGSLQDKTIAIQGLGNVGSYLLKLLFPTGAKILISDIDNDKQKILSTKYKAYISNNILEEKCDIFAPCALGGIIHTNNINKLKCKAIAGAANNQLLTEDLHFKLHKLGILYVPDFAINAGGIINVSQELKNEGYDFEKSKSDVDKIYYTIKNILHVSKVNNKTPYEISINIAKNNLKY